MKLLIVATVERTLGAFLLPFADHFRARGWTVDGMAADISTNPRYSTHFDRIWEMEWTRDPLDRRNFSSARRIREIALSHRYDLVHVHTPIAGFVTRLALRELPRGDRPKVVYTAHGFHCHPGETPGRNAIYCCLEKLAGLWTDGLVVMNHEDERLARRLDLAGRGLVFYMPGIGIDLDCYSRLRISSDAIAEVRRELRLEPNSRLFLMVAAFDPGKRHLDAVRALHLMRERSQVHLAFAGTGPETERTNALVQKLKLGDRTHFLNTRSDVPILLAASDALVLPSEREGLPRAILEAMAMHTPAIGTRIRGIDELLDGGAGLLVKRKDPQGLSDAMCWVLDNPNEARAMANLAYQRVRRYSLARILALHEDMYSILMHFQPRTPHLRSAVDLM